MRMRKTVPNHASRAVEVTARTTSGIREMPVAQKLNILKSAEKRTKHMKHPGLVSISFRSLTPAEIIPLAAGAGLHSIEWGADVHCKPGDFAAAEQICALSEKHGTASCAYGSYYRAGEGEDVNADFTDILATAKALHTDIIRVWAGIHGSAEASSEQRAAVREDLARICALAAPEGVKISLECHNNTLTDDYNSALRLLDEVGCSNLTMYWQPNQFKSLDYNLESARALRDVVTNVHVFNWAGKEKYPLAGATDVWKRYVSLLEGSRYEHRYLLEFMPHGSPEELTAEARSLAEGIL